MALVKGILLNRYHMHSRGRISRIARVEVRARYLWRVEGDS